MAKALTPTPQPKRPNRLGRGFQYPDWMKGRISPLPSLDFTSLEATERLKQSVWAYSCVRAYTDCISQLEFRAQRWEREAQDFVDEREHPIEERFDDPNPYQSTHDLIGTNAQDFLRTGNFLTNCLDFDSPKRRSEGFQQHTWRLEALHSDYVKPVINEVDLFHAYCVSKEGWGLVGAPRDGNLVDVRDMVHGKLPNPDNPLWGLSPLQVGKNTLDAEIAAIKWNKSLVENSAKTSMVFTTDMPLSEPEHTLLTKRVRENYSGSSAGIPMVLDHGLKPLKMGMEPVEMDWVESSYLEATKVCALLRCPPPVIGIARDATLANLVEYYKQFWLSGVLPLVEFILAAYNRVWVKNRWPGFRLWYDTSKVQALREDTSAKISDAERLVALGYTLNEAAAKVELGMPEIPTGNIRYQTAGLIPIYVGNRPLVSINTGKPEAVDAEIVEEEETAEDGGPKAPQLPESTDPDEKAFPTNERSRKAYFAAFERERESFYGRLMESSSELVLEDLKAAATALQGLKNVDDDTIDPLLDEALAANEEEWAKFFRSSWQRVGQHFFERTGTSLRLQKHRRDPKQSKNFLRNFWEDAIAEYVEKRLGEKIVSVTETTKRWVKALALSMFSESGTIDDLARQISELGPAYSVKRGWRIGRTETIGASNYASNQAAQQEEVDLKQWVDSGDDRVRSSHRQMNGQKRRLNEPYSNGMMFPGDPDGPAREVIHCRCVEAYYVGDIDD